MSREYTVYIQGLKGHDMDADLIYVDTLIKAQSRAVAVYLTIAIAFASIGIMILVAVFKFHQQLNIPDGMREIVGIGGGFVSSLTLVPTKEIVSRTERREIYRSLKQMLDQSADKTDPMERKRVKALVWDAFNKIARGE